MRVGAGEIGLHHQLGDLAGVGRRHAGLDHGIDDERGDGGDRDALAGVGLHDGLPDSNVSARPPRMLALSSSEIRKPRTWLHAVQHAHVVGIVAAEQHVVGADLLDQEFQHRRGMQDGVVEEALGDVLRLLRHVLLRLRPHRPAVLPARRLIGREAAAMRQHDLQFRIAVEHAAEHQAGRRDGGVERIADQVGEIIRLQPVGAGDVVGMDEHEGAELFGRRPQRLEHRIVEVDALDVGGKHRAAQAELGHGAPQLVGGRRRLRQRQRGDAPEAVGMGGDVLGHLVVLDGGERGRQRGVEIVEIGLRRGRQHVHVDARRIHVAQAARDVEAAGRERPVDGAHDVERGGLGVGRRDRHLGARLGQQRGGFLGQDVGVGVDGPQLGHFVP